MKHIWYSSLAVASQVHRTGVELMAFAVNRESSLIANMLARSNLEPEPPPEAAARA